MSSRRACPASLTVVAAVFLAVALAPRMLGASPAVAAQAVATFRVGIRIVPVASPVPRRAPATRPSPPARSGSSAVAAGRSIVIRPGDTLMAIAARTYADPARYLDIFAANRDILASPHLLPVGRRLRLP